MIFTPHKCRILASSGTKTNIEFYWCEFQDEGAAFVEAFAARQDETSGLAKRPVFLSQHKLESLELQVFDLDSEVSCRAVANNASGGFASSSTKRDRAKAIADMLLVNTHIDEIIFCGGPSFNQGDWNALLVLSIISTGSGLLQSQRSRNCQPVLPSWREPWLVWRGNLRWYGWSSLRTTTSFEVTWTKHVTTPSRFRRESAFGRLPMMTRMLTTISCQERALVERILSSTRSNIFASGFATVSDSRFYR
jgi:hypothetical protein